MGALGVLRAVGCLGVRHSPDLFTIDLFCLVIHLFTSGVSVRINTPLRITIYG
jgi:hypothetical protein